VPFVQKRQERGGGGRRVILSRLNKRFLASKSSARGRSSCLEGMESSSWEKPVTSFAKEPGKEPRTRQAKKVGSVVLHGKKKGKGKEENYHSVEY